MKIKFFITPEWLLEWFWSLVKLDAFQWPHKLIACQTDSSNTKSGKLQKLGGGQKIFIFRGGYPIRGVNFLGGSWYSSAHSETIALKVLSHRWKFQRSCHFNKLGPGTIFQSPVLSQKHVRNVFHNRIWPNFILIVFRIQKK